MAVSNNAAHHRVRPSRRCPKLTVAGLAAALSLLPVPMAEATGPAATAAAPAAAVRALTAPTAAAVQGSAGHATRLPDDFGDISGYRPALVDGILVAPHGSCSSPVPLPTEFETACKAHDLGYDLLRYAEHGGDPLGPWARQDLDRTLTERMRAACIHRPEALARTRCAAMAEVASTAVGLNSARQSYGVPVVERSAFTIALSLIPQFGGPALAALIVLLLGRAVLRTGPPWGTGAGLLQPRRTRTRSAPAAFKSFSPRPEFSCTT